MHKGKYSTALGFLIERLKAHAQPNGLLDGFRLKEAPQREILGRDDVRVIGVFLPEIQEQWQGQNVVVAMMTAVMGIGTRKADGVLKHVEAVELVLNALEWNVSLGYDPTFGGLLRYPLSAAVGKQVTLELSYNSELRVDLNPVTQPRRGRVR